MSFFDDLKSQVTNTWSDVTSVGVPAVIAGVENYASQQLASQAKQNQVQAQAAVSEVAAKPGTSSGVMLSIQNTFKDVAANEVVKNYGIYIVAGLIALIIIVRKVK